MEGIDLEIKRRRRRRPHKSKNKISVQVENDYFTVAVDSKTNEVSIKSQQQEQQEIGVTKESKETISDDLLYHHHHHHHGMLINGCGCSNEPVPGSENCCTSESSHAPKRRNRCRSKRRNSACRILEEKIAQHEELIENLMKSQTTCSFPQFVVRDKCPMVVTSQQQQQQGGEKNEGVISSTTTSDTNNTEPKKGNKLKSGEKIANFYKTLSNNCNKDVINVTSIDEVEAGDIIYFKQLIVKKSGPKPSGLKKAKVFLKMKKGESTKPNSILFRTFGKFNHGMPAEWIGNSNESHKDLSEPLIVEFSELVDVSKEVSIRNNAAATTTTSNH